MAENRVIGFNNSIPWNLPEDLSYFKNKTLNSTVLMGRKTFDSIPANFKPLSKRQSIVISKIKSNKVFSDTIFLNNLENFILDYKKFGFSYFKDLNKKYTSSNILWVIGGEAIYKQTLKFADEIFLTKVKLTPQGDSYFPKFESDFKLKNRALRLASKDGLVYSHNHYIRRP